LGNRGDAPDADEEEFGVVPILPALAGDDCGSGSDGLYGDAPGPAAPEEAGVMGSRIGGG